MFGQKFVHLKKAKELLAAGDMPSLRHCCLELRFCLEFLAYEQIELHEKELPEEVFKSWQPKRVIEELLAYDPSIENDFTLAMGPEGTSGETPRKMFLIGKFNALKRPFVQKNYSKLGSFLHAPTFGQLRSNTCPVPDKLRPFLEGLLPQIEDLCSSTVWSNFGNFASFECTAWVKTPEGARRTCRQKIVRNVESLKPDSVIACTKTECRAQYTVSDLETDKPSFQPLQVELECFNCKTTNFIDKHRLQSGLRITCVNCSQIMVAYRAWAFSPPDEA